MSPSYPPSSTIGTRSANSARSYGTELSDLSRPPPAVTTTDRHPGTFESGTDQPDIGIPLSHTPYQSEEAPAASIDALRKAVERQMQACIPYLQEALESNLADPQYQHQRRTPNIFVPQLHSLRSTKEPSPHSLTSALISNGVTATCGCCCSCAFGVGMCMSDDEGSTRAGGGCLICCAPCVQVLGVVGLGSSILDCAVCVIPSLVETAARSLGTRNRRSDDECEMCGRLAENCLGCRRV